MNTFTIKDLENFSGIKAHTLRIWELRYNLLKPKRTTTNIRYYSGDELKTILNISLLNKNGNKISHINKMDAPEITEKLGTLVPAVAREERIVNELILAMLSLEIETFETVLNDSVVVRGLDQTITQIIFPFLERIGFLWNTCLINPLQENLVTQIIRKKLILGIENLATDVVTRKHAVLFLPKGEYQEIGLLYFHYLLKSKGFKVLYLGANVPLPDLELITKLSKPDFLYTHLNSVNHKFNIEKFLNSLNQKMPDMPVVVSGALTKQYKMGIPDTIKFKNSSGEVNEFLLSCRGLP